MTRKPAASSYKEAFGKRLRVARIKAGYRTYSEFAERVGVVPETYRNYETGTKSPKFDTLARISIELDVSLDYLILGKRP